MFSIIDPIVTERQWPGETGRPMTQEYLRSTLETAATRGLLVHIWTGEGRDGKPLAVVWVAGKRVGQLLRGAFEITGR